MKNLSTAGKAALLILSALAALGLFSDSVSRCSAAEPSGPALSAPSWTHPLGTDDLGIDLWTQLCRGARLSLLLGLSASLLSVLLGGSAGCLAGFKGGALDAVLMRSTDVLIVLPDLPLFITAGAFFGPGTGTMIVLISLFSWTVPARLVRSRVLSICKEGYITAAVAAGASFAHLVRRHFARRLLPLLLVSGLRILGKAVVAEASLSFLGLGDPASKSWGRILHFAVNFKGIFFTDYWKWWVLSPLAALTLFVGSVAFLARDLETLLDGKLAGRSVEG